MPQIGKRIHNKPIPKSNRVKKVKNEIPHISIKNLALCLIVALILVMILTFILAVISVNSTILDNNLSIWEIAAIAVAVLISGFICGRRNGAKGLYNGLLLGVLFAIVIMIFSVSNHSFSTIPFLIKAATALVAGGIGGIVGVK